MMFLNSTLPRNLGSYGLKGHTCMITMFSDTEAINDAHKKCKGTTLVYNMHMVYISTPHREWRMVIQC